MGKKFKKILAITFLITLIMTGLMITFSPYGPHKEFEYKLVKHTIVIAQPCEQVYTYLGKSSHARDWSSFVHHITPLNPEEVPDGKVGSKRRCFVTDDENGQRWDEEIVLIEENRRRCLTIFNLVDFPITAEGLATEQIYETTDDGNCQLTFTVFFKDGNPTVAERLKMYFGAYVINSIFKKNLEIIKKIVEDEG